ncbi:MAG: serine protease [Thermoleophilia bacterium]|jgi:S1-C subfamily serine protease|nr:serine protease [Thermoleophilia bacterium]
MPGEPCTAPSLYAYVVPPVLAPAGPTPSFAALRARSLLRSIFVAAAAVVALLVLAVGLAGSLDAPGSTAAGGDPAETVMRSVAEIHVQGVDASGTVRTALGTGVVIKADGLIVTNDHVITMAGGQVAASVRVVAADGREAVAGFVTRVPDLDLAFVQVDLAGLTPATFATDLAEVETAAPVFAVGAPGEFAEPVADGIVTEVLENMAVPQRPDLDTLIESSTQLEQGFSGGPLADAEGRVIGINVATLGVEQGTRTLGLAIPSAVVLEAAAELSAPTPPRAPPERKTPGALRRALAGVR